MFLQTSNLDPFLKSKLKNKLDLSDDNPGRAQVFGKMESVGYAGFNEIFENGPPLASGRGLCQIDLRCPGTAK